MFGRASLCFSLLLQWIFLVFVWKADGFHFLLSHGCRASHRQFGTLNQLLKQPHVKSPTGTSATVDTNPITTDPSLDSDLNADSQSGSLQSNPNFKASGFRLDSLGPQSEFGHGRVVYLVETNTGFTVQIAQPNANTVPRVPLELLDICACAQKCVE